MMLTLCNIYQEPSISFLRHAPRYQYKRTTRALLCRDMDFQILLTGNYYTNPNSMHLCFPMKIKKATNKDADIDYDLITVNSFLRT